VKLFDLHYRRLGFEQSQPVEIIEEKPIPIQRSLFDIL